MRPIWTSYQKRCVMISNSSLLKRWMMCCALPWNYLLRNPNAEAKKGPRSIHNIIMPKVSLIEDDASMLYLLGTLLEFEGFQVAQLNGGMNLEETLESLRREKPHPICTDVHLPAISSFDLLQRLRED